MASTSWIFILLLALTMEFGLSAAGKCFDDTRWESFKQRFKKSYADCNEENKRSRTLAATINFVEKHNAEAAQGRHSYYLGLNPLSDLDQAEYGLRLGFRAEGTTRVKRGAPIIKTYKNTVNVNTLNATVNWTATGWVTPVVDQGKCGSCWAYSATGAIESQYKNKTNNLVQLSPQNLIPCSSVPYSNVTSNQGCGGGDPKAAFKWVSYFGQELLSDYPSTSNTNGLTGTCLYNATKSVVQLSGYFNIDANETAIQQAVAKVGPVVVAIDASVPTFQSYKTGIYAGNCSQLITGLNHAVQVVGYGTDNGTDYWLIKNSWGPNWGEQGYMRMARNVNMCGVKLYAAVPIVGTAV